MRKRRLPGRGDHFYLSLSALKKIEREGDPKTAVFRDLPGILNRLGEPSAPCGAPDGEYSEPGLLHRELVQAYATCRAESQSGNSGWSGNG